MVASKFEIHKTALIVDDDPSMIMLLTKILEAAGLSVISALDVAGAIELFDEHCPHIVFLDLNLGDQKSYPLLEHRQQNPKFHQIPIIMLTADGSKKAVYESVRRGASDYIVKPINAAKIVQKLKKMFLSEEILTYKFTEGEKKVGLTTQAEVSRFSELEVMLDGPFKLQAGQHVDLESEFLKSVGHFVPEVEVIRDGRLTKERTFENVCQLKGLTEEVSAELRRKKNKRV